MLVTLVALNFTETVKAGALADQLYLEGIGYREQELQVAKGTKFASEEPNGVNWASFAGGTHIFIRGVGLDENPQSNTISFRSQENDQLVIPIPLLTEDDAFNSQPMLGNIAYRLPALNDIINPNVVS
jgi:hypothetical protein